MVKIGATVLFSDPQGIEHAALVTQVWGERKRLENGEWTPEPAINLVYVSDDETKTDQYGRQIERNTSVVHKVNQSAHGMFWTEWHEPAV